MLIFKPRNVNNKHNDSDKKMYENAWKNFLLKSKSILSIENVEKVVKDPNTPIIKKYFTKSKDNCLVSMSVIKKPIINDPNMLTSIVLKNI